MSSSKEYLKFLESKIKSVSESGFDIDVKNLNKKLFEFQKFIVKTALKKGRYALFEDCGLGKTIQQLEWAYQVSIHTNKPVLILCPLAVAGQTIKEGLKFGYIVTKIHTDTLITNGLYITNYEQLENIDCDLFAGVVLDESSILKNFDGKLKELITKTFKDTHYKLCCTATPSPNDPMEIGTHAEFLNVMSRNEMLSMYFVHDGGDTAKWRLKRHSIDLFWDWVSEWAIMISKPSDIGFEDTGYKLPKLNLIDKKVITEIKDNGKLFNDISVSAIDFNAELRITLIKRIEEVETIVNNSDENFIVWVKQNEESEKLTKVLVNAYEVKGSDSVEYKEKTLLDFADNKFKVLVTKSKIAQFGMNFQNCHNQVFASLDFSFEALYQSIRRSYRFGQKSEVNIYLITTDTMENVIAIVKEKQKHFLEMQKQMCKTTRKNYLKINQSKIKSEKSKPVKNEYFEMINGDCVKNIKNIQSESIGLSIFSPPFAELYVYSDNLEDMGNSKNYNEFFEHFEYLIPELNRVMIPGRILAIHCMDLPIQKGKEGYIGLRDFSGMIIDNFQKNGFIYHSRVTIWKDPVIEMQRTKALGLLHKQVKKDSSMSRVGLPDYMLIFRKEGLNPQPITNDKIPVDLWQKYASPIWYDINYSNTLQRESAREDKDEKHICPLQLDTIERTVRLWSNEGDTVFSPFAGIGSEGYISLKENRKFKGIELKESYFKQAVKNLNSVIEEKKQLSLAI